MKLTDIVEGFQEKRSKVLKKTFFMNALTRGNFTSAYQKMLDGKNIFRGIAGSASYPFWIVSPSKFRRESRNTSNFYTGLIDGLPSWKNYPKRSRSIICTNSSNAASGYGNVLRVLPKNGAKIGICPFDDFWTSFYVMSERLNLPDMDYFNVFFTKIFTYLGHGHEVDNLSEETYKDFISAVNNGVTKEKFIGAISDNSVSFSYTVDSRRKDVIRDLESNFNGDWEKYFDDLLNPDENSFDLQTIETYTGKEKTYSDNEVWTDAVSLMVSTGYDAEIMRNRRGDVKI